MRGRKGIPLPRRLERPGRGSVEDPDCRTAAQGRLALARRRGRAPGGLQQSRSAALSGGSAGHARPGGTGRALVCSHPGPGWPAPDVAARPGECPQALSDPCRRAQSRTADAPVDRGRNPEGSRGAWLVFSCPAPVLLPTSNGAYEALIMVLVAHSAIPALIVVNMRFDRRSD